jgi:hypothetical protein
MGTDKVIFVGEQPTPSVTGSHGNCTTIIVVIQNVPVAHAHTITSVTDVTSGEKSLLWVLRNFRLRITYFWFRTGPLSVTRIRKIKRITIKLNNRTP